MSETGEELSEITQYFRKHLLHAALLYVLKSWGQVALTLSQSCYCPNLEMLDHFFSGINSDKEPKHGL